MSAMLMDVEDLVGLPERVEEQLSEVAACCLAFNRWGTLLAAGCMDGTVALYDYQTRGVGANLLNGHTPGSHVSALLWSNDGHTLLSGARNGSLVAWQVASGQVQQVVALPSSSGAVTHLAWAHGYDQSSGHQGQRQDQDEVLVSMAAGPAVLLRLSDGHQQQLPVICIDGDSKQANGVAEPASCSGQVAVPSHDGALIYAGTRGAVMVLRRSDLALLDVIKVDGGPRILSLQLDRSGRRLMLTATDSHIRIFLLHRPGDRQLLRGQQRLARAAASKATGGEPGNPAAPAAQQPLAPADWQVHSLESAATAAAAAASAPASRRHKNSLFFDDSSAWLTWHLDFTPEASRRQWKCAAFTPDGEYFASALEGGGQLYLYEADAESRMSSVLEAQGTRGGVTALCWHPSAAPMQLLAVDGGGTINIWAKAFTENWSAFAPDFAELHRNEVYVEPEDEFDMNPRPAESAGLQGQQAGGGCCEEEEAEDVDIGTPAPRQQDAAAQLGLSPDRLPLMHLPLVLNMPASGKRASDAAAAVPSPAVERGVPAAAVEFNAAEGPLFDEVQRELAAAREQARTAELKTAEAVKEASEWMHVVAKAEVEKREANSFMEQAHVELDRSQRLAGRAAELRRELYVETPQVPPTSPRTPLPLPRGRSGLLQLAERLARHAASLEEEAKREEAKACYLASEAEHLEALSLEKQKRVNELEEEQWKAAEAKHREAAKLGGAGAEIEAQAVALAQEADVRAVRLELHFPEAEQAVQHVETVRNAVIQARRDAQLLSSRATKLEDDALKVAEGAKALMQRASEKAAKSLEAKRAAQNVYDQSGLEAHQTTTTPSLPIQRLSKDLDRTEKGIAAAELHAAQLAEEARRKTEHAGLLERAAESKAAHMGRLQADAAQARTKEEEALQHAQRSGEAASRRAGARMAEQWLALEASPEWQTLARRFPETLLHLMAAAKGGVQPVADA
ncbi:Retinoblastoma-binding protein 5 [Chlorella vulgaris]